MVNCVTLVGRLTKDIELIKTGNGTTVGNFSIAVNRRDETTFVNCTAFNKTAENMDIYTQKGMLIGLVGRLQSSNYTAKDGTKRTSMTVIANEVVFLERKPDPKKPEENFDITEEDLPF